MISKALHRRLCLLLWPPHLRPSFLLSVGPYPFLLTPRQEPFEHLMRKRRPAHLPPHRGSGEHRVGSGHNTATQQVSPSGKALWCPSMPDPLSCCLFTFISPYLHPTPSSAQGAPLCLGRWVGARGKKPSKIPHWEQISFSRKS